MSSDKSFYRYKIFSAEDVLLDTYKRRHRKSLQNSKTNFIFEIDNSNSIEAGKINLFLSENFKADDLVLISPQNLSALKIDLLRPESVVLRINKVEDLKIYKSNFQATDKNYSLLFTPTTKPELNTFVQFTKALGSSHESSRIYWRFKPYNPNINSSLTVRDIAQNSDVKFNKFLNIEIENSAVPIHYELEPIENDSYEVLWKTEVADSQPLVSVIIPTYNNSFFLHNVILHLIQQSLDAKSYEVIVVDDGSKDSSSEMIQELFQLFPKKINLTYIYWNKSHKQRGEQNFFRAGLVRNIGVRHSKAEYLQFLDSDMLVPENFLEMVLENLKGHDIIQFQRFHIKQDKSKTNPIYKNIDLKKDTYIEEESYWSQLFFCENWQDLPHYWKYTCTYALGIKKKHFLKVGMFKKYYISYGFEDTDLGYEAYNLGLKFKIIKTPLMHLTSYDQMQYKNSKTKRLQLLRVTAELFYLQHLKKDIYDLLVDFYRFQKPVKSYFRDLFN